jgi:hypothetical protein
MRYLKFKLGGSYGSDWKILVPKHLELNLVWYYI